MSDLLVNSATDAAGSFSAPRRLTVRDERQTARCGMAVHRPTYAAAPVPRTAGSIDGFTTAADDKLRNTSLGGDHIIQAAHSNFSQVNSARTIYNLSSGD